MDKKKAETWILVLALAIQVASFETKAGETLHVEVTTDSGRPKTIPEYMAFSLRRLLGTAAWRVGTTPISTVTSQVTITVTGSNIASTATVDYYLEGVPRSGGQAHRFLAGNATSVAVGTPLTDSEALTVNGHLQSMGLSTSQDQTVDYYVYVSVEATGLISGETLTCDIAKTLFDTITFDYGGVSQNTVTTTTDYDGHIKHTTSSGSYLKYTTKTYLNLGLDDDADTKYRPFAKFSLSSIPDDATILQVNWTMYVAGGAFGTYESDVYSLEYNPATAANDVLYNDMGDGSLLYSSWTKPANGLHEYALTSEACTYVQNSLARNWCGLGMRLKNEAGSDGYINIAAIESSYQEFKLEITYETANWGLSWSWYPIPPLSLTQLPITMDVVALAALMAATILLLRRKKYEPGL